MESVASENALIDVVMDTEQQFLIDYNKDKTNKEKIPLVPRNKKTGWPLLQMSLFTFDTKLQRYDPALGGGECHFLNLNFYFLAALLRQSFYYNDKDSNFTLNLSSIIQNGKQFSVKLNAFPLEVKAERGEMGYTQYFILFNGEKLKILNLIVSYINKAVLNENKIKLLDPTYAGFYLTEKQIIDNINKEFCTFHNGQIFLDVEKMLTTEFKIISHKHDPTIDFKINDQKVEGPEYTTRILKVDEDIVSMFATIFHVDKFKTEYQKHLKADQEKAVSSVNEIKTAENQLANIKQLFGNYEDKLDPDTMSVELIERTKNIKSPLEKLRTLDRFFQDVVNKTEITYEYFRPSMSIFFNNQICNTQKEDIKAIKLAYLMTIKKALLDEGEVKLSFAEKKQIIKHARKENSLIDYHTKFLFGYTNTRNSFDRLVTYAQQNGFLEKQRRQDRPQKEIEH